MLPMLLMRWCCWCADAAYFVDALMRWCADTLMRWCCWWANTADVLMLLMLMMRWCCWWADAAVAMMLWCSAMVQFRRTEGNICNNKKQMCCPWVSLLSPDFDLTCKDIQSSDTLAGKGAENGLSPNSWVMPWSICKALICIWKVCFGKTSSGSARKNTIAGNWKNAGPP